LLDIDYDIYAEGEAELGWLNTSFRVSSNEVFSLDAMLLRLVEELKQRLADSNAETAHLKAIGLWEGFFGVANLVSSDSAAELSLPSDCQVSVADMIINARVACDPDQLKDTVMSVVKEVLCGFSATAEFRSTQSFRPGRPEPTHRITELSD
jgi:hypothetical protein